MTYRAVTKAIAERKFVNETNMKDDSGKTLNGNAYKHPIFDGENPNEFKSWWDNVHATLEMEDLEEYLTIEYKDIVIPTKESGETDSVSTTEIELAKKNKLVRKEMKKAKAHMVKVTKDFPKRLVMEATTPYEAYAALKTKYSVAKNRNDFVRLDREWNEFKVTDEKADPDKVFATLDEHSKKIAEFGTRYEKDSLQILSKLEVAMPTSYEHVFTLLNTDEEYKKDKDVQLVTAKRMIKAHYESNVKTIESGKDAGSMMCMFVGNNGNDTSKKGTYKCDHCGKSGHTAFKDNKPFCRALVAELKGDKGNGNGGGHGKGNRDGKHSGSFKWKCHNCGIAGHKARDCTKEKKSSDMDDVNNLTIGMVQLEENEIEVSHVVDGGFVEMLGDTGAQGHVSPPRANIDKEKHYGFVKMANGAKSKIYQKDNVIIEDEVGNTLELKDRRVVDGISTHIISLTQLMREGWSMKGAKNKDTRFIYMSKNGTRLTFAEGKMNLFYLTAKVVDETIIANYTTLKVDDPAVISDDEDSENEEDFELPELISRGREDDSDSEDENDEPVKKKPKEKPKVTFKDTLVDESKLLPFSMNDAHDRWGHFGEARLRKMATLKGLRLVGKLTACDACGLIKTKASPIAKSSPDEKKSKEVGERLYVDITGPFPLTGGKWHKSIRNKMFWYGMIDEFSGKMISSFQYEKSKLVDMVAETFDFFNGREQKVKHVRMDNAGENQAVEKLCKSKNITVEYTPPDTPKLNHMVERGFAIRWEGAKVLMQNAGLKPNVKSNKIILVEAIKTASFLYEEGPRKGKEFSINELFFGIKGKERVKSKHFIEWGRFGFVCNKRTKTRKMESRGTAMMMVGYAMDHPSGTYRFYNPTTDSIVVSNSVKWSDYKRWEAASVDSAVGNLKEPTKATDIETNDQNEAVENSNPVTNENTETDVLPTPPPVIRRAITRHMTQADTTLKQSVYQEFNEATGKNFKVTGDITPMIIDGTEQPKVTNLAEDHDATTDVEVSVVWTDELVTTCENIGGIDDLIEYFVMHACIQSDPGEPTRWKEALEGPEREWWMRAITSEFNNFLKRGAWKFVPIDDAKNSGRRLIPTKLVFKKKDEIDGSIRFKARDVTLGFMMVPGVDFTERFSPVATDESLRTQIAINLKYWTLGWRTMSCDIEAAFLEPDMDNEMYIEPHPALVACGFMTEAQRKTLAILLKKSMYGNVDAAIKFFKLLAEHMKKMEMKQSLADPCVFYKLDANGELLLMVSVTVDDCAVTGLPNDIEWFMTNLETRFKITKGGLLSKHLGIDYEWGVLPNGKAFAKATMDKKIKNIIKVYEEHIGREAKIYDTPGKPNEYLGKHDGEPVEIEKYRSLVGQIMFFTTKLGLKLGNSTRALSGFMSNPNEAHWTALGRIVGYLKGRSFNGILYVEPESFRVISFADTDYGNCTETRRSVGCTIITIGGCLTDWSMAKHLTLSDSSCEAEYKELAKCAKGVKFTQMLLGELRLLEIPGILFEDNSGSIFLAQNKQVSKRTKHIDLKHHFIREFTECQDGIQYGKIYKIESEFNTADIGTKNVEARLFKRHEEEVDNGMPALRERVYGDNGVIK